MRNSEVFINYWIGQEPNPPSPTLNEMPAFVNIAPLAFVSITEDYQLSFDFLTQHFPASEIQGWIRGLRENGTKVLLSINDQKIGSIPADKQARFVQNVAENVLEWGVDGLDFDYEPPADSSSLAPLIQTLRAALPGGSVFTAPVYSPWTSYPGLLRAVAGAVDYVTTMDYTPYPGYNETIDLCSTYARIIGGWSKLVIGMSCMGPSTSGNFTPLEDVERLAAYTPPSTARKGGAMLYTFSYDVKSRRTSSGGASGTGYPDGTWTNKVHQCLPKIRLE